MRIIFCGGRDYADRTAVSRVLLALDADVVTVVHGGARGADSIVGELAEDIGWGPFRVEVYPAEWDLYGKGAGPRRNAQMLASGADLVVAFPGGVGTDDMKRRARAAGVPVMEIT